MRYALFTLILLFIGCVDVDPVEEQDVEGYEPVYGELSHLKISFQDPKEVKNPGKIYLYQNYLLINEVNSGVHVYDNSDPENPEAMGFVEMVGNTDMIIRNDVLYANHYGSLVALDFADFNSIKELGRLPINNWLTGLPPPSGHYFECVDEGRGVVLGWKKKKLTNPDCYAY